MIVINLKWALTRFLFLLEVSFITRKNQNEDLVNEAIRFREVLVIGQNGEQLGVMMRREALEKAYELELDLLCVAPNAQPPVCKILDYGKYRFEAQKKAKEAKKNQHVTEVKPMRLSPVIDTHDFETKLKNAKNYVEKGHKVKVSVKFKGRELAHPELGKDVLIRFAEATSAIAEIEQNPKLEGKFMTMILTPKKDK